MNHYDELPEDILDLLAQKKYEQLSRDEKDLVKNWLSPEAYDEYAAMLLSFREVENSFDTPAPSQALPEHKPTFLRKLVNYKIPAYQAVAAVFITLLLVNLSTSNKENNKHISQPFFSTNNGDTVPVNTKNAIEVGEKSMGTPLSEDNYPEELVFNL